MNPADLALMYAELVKHVIDSLPKDERGSVDRDEAERVLAQELIRGLDIKKEALSKAKRILRSCLTPGHSEVSGQMTLPGIEPYAYEPYRLVASRDRMRLIQLRNATLHFKEAEAERARHNKKIADLRAEIKTLEADHMANWIHKCALEDRSQRDWTWENCIKETGLWSEGEAPPEVSTDDEED